MVLQRQPWSPLIGPDGTGPGTLCARAVCRPWSCYLHSPELNSAGNVFQFLKANHFASRVIDATGDVKAKVAAVWENFTGQAERIESTGHRPCANKTLKVFR